MTETSNSFQIDDITLDDNTPDDNTPNDNTPHVNTLNVNSPIHIIIIQSWGAGITLQLINIQAERQNKTWLKHNQNQVKNDQEMQDILQAIVHWVVTKDSRSSVLEVFELHWWLILDWCQLIIH